MKHVRSLTFALHPTKDGNRFFKVYYTQRIDQAILNILHNRSLIKQDPLTTTKIITVLSDCRDFVFGSYDNHGYYFLFNLGLASNYEQDIIESNFRKLDKYLQNNPIPKRTIRKESPIVKEEDLWYTNTIVREYS